MTSYLTEKNSAYWSRRDSIYEDPETGINLQCKEWMTVYVKGKREGNGWFQMSQVMWAGPDMLSLSKGQWTAIEKLYSRSDRVLRSDLGTKQRTNWSGIKMERDSIKK